MARRTGFLNRHLAATTALCLTVPLHGGWAQDSAGDTRKTKPIEEIIVTAEHRAEDITKVPMSITAMTGDDLEERGIKTMSDLSREVPGLNFQSQGDSFGSTQISLRGISSKTGAAPTGVYIDDTPIQVRLNAFSGTTNPYPKVFDLDRVEVLKGPQGTLFGSGSEGGTVRFITPEPSLSTFTGLAHGDVSITQGGDPSWEAGAALGGPLVEGKLGVRASLWTQHDGGWVDRVDGSTGVSLDTNANRDQSKVGRIAFKYAPTDRLTITPSLYYQDVYTHDTDLWWLPGSPAPYNAGGRYSNLTQQQQPDEDRFFLTGLNIAYDFDAFTLKSISSSFFRKDRRLADSSTFDLSYFVPYGDNSYGGLSLPGGEPFVSTLFLTNSQQNYDQEIRLISRDDPASRWSWSGGLFWSHNRQNLSYVIKEPLATVANDPTVIANWGLACAPGSCSVEDLMGTPMIGANGDTSDVDEELQEESEVALYANAAYQVTDALKIEAGVRGGRSEYQFHIFQNGPWNAHQLPDGTESATIDNSASKTEFPITPRFSASYQVTPRTMIYATAAEGYRIGGGNEDLGALASCQADFQNLGIPGNPLTYNSDTVWSYELGTKGGNSDRTLQFDAAGFWINWNNIQSVVYLPTCGYEYTANLGHAVSRGGELSARWRVLDSVTLSGNVAYTNAVYTSTTVVGGNILALKGDSLNTPPLTFTLSPEYRTSLGADADLYLRADFDYASHYTRTGSDSVYTFDAVTRNGLATTNLSLRAGVAFGGWDLSLYAKNLLNENTITFLYHDTVVSPGVRAESMTPRTIGLTGDYRF